MENVLLKKGVVLQKQSICLSGYVENKRILKGGK
jgi:hypothetical protein